MSAKKPRARGAFGAGAAFLGMSVVAGLLVAAAVTPAIAVTGMAANNGIGVFEGLPEYLEPGTLAQIAQVIADNDGNISNLKIVKSAPDFSQLSIDLEVWDLKHLNRLLGDLRERHVVSSANRVNA